VGPSDDDDPARALGAHRRGLTWSDAPPAHGSSKGSIGFRGSSARSPSPIRVAQVSSGPSLSTAPFPSSPYAITFDQPNRVLDSCLAPLLTTPLKDLCVALVDLTGGTARPPIATMNGDQEIGIGSVAKLGVMYAAFELRERVRAAVAELLAAGMSTRSATWPRDAYRAIELAWKVRVNDPFRVAKLDTGFPNLASIFTIDRRGTVDFSTAGRSDSAIDSIGEFGSLRGLRFREWMILMMRWSHNGAAGECIHALSWPYLNGALGKAGLFDATTGLGLWLTSSFSRYPSWNGGRGVALDPVWKKRYGVSTTTQGGTARVLARLLSLMMTDRLVSAPASAEMRTLIDRVAHPGAAGYARAGLRRARRPFQELFAKVGYVAPKGRPKAKAFHDAAAVVRTGPGSPFTFVAVVLGAKRYDPDMFVLFTSLYDCIAGLHP
jgi:hypothetical protein